jgi:phosphatidylglycerol:prolipoprotein diacylglycerol transferase
MWRTLFTVPHQIGGIPVLGIGWLLAVLLLAYAAYVFWNWKDPLRRRDALNQWPTVALMAVAIAWILPAIELRNIRGEPLGLAVRGYGVFLMLSIAAALGLSLWRAQRRGYPLDQLYSLTLWLVIGGLVGARLFYLIEYRDQFVGRTWTESLGAALNFTRGGMVVYGALLGGLLAGLVVTRHYKLPIRKTADLIIPGVFLGVALGRIGCLLNGCCYGDRCEPSWWAAEFPPGSPPYEMQLSSGELVGLTLSSPTDSTGRRVEAVAKGSLAEQAGLAPGMVVQQMGPVLGPDDPRLPAEDSRNLGLALLADGREFRWSANELPSRSLPLVPAQLIGAVTALVLVGWLVWMDRWHLRDGMLLGLGFAGYAVIRFGLEMVRNDEPGQFGTSWTIAQWVSVVTLLCCGIYFYGLYRSDPRQAGPNHPS